MIDIRAALAGASTAGIGGHVRPDGDCVGACLGLYLFIRKYYPDIDCEIRLGEFSPSFMFLKDADKILHDFEEEKIYDVYFCLDCTGDDRLGPAAHYKKAAKKTVCIDHHVSSVPYCDINEIVPDASSASELTALLIGEEFIDKDMAEALYMGIAHDTGVFQYSNTSPRTMVLAAELMKKGINHSKIVEDTYYTKTLPQQRILGKCLSDAVTIMDGQIIFCAVTLSEMAFYGLSSTDIDGISSALRQTQGVHAAIFLHEVASQVYKVSLRSDDKVNVSEVARHFGGGGHVRAAGCTMQGSIHDAVNNLTAQIARQLDRM